MKKPVFTLALILLGFLQVQAQNPYAALGIEEQVLHYDDTHEEVFGNDTIKPIGYAIYNPTLGLLTIFDLADSLVAVQIIDPSKVARFLSGDPRSDKYPGWSPYNYVLGNPIRNTDPRGDTVRIEGSKKFVKQTNIALDKIKNTKEGASLYDKLHSEKKFYTIRQHSSDATKVSNISNLPESWSVGDIGFSGEKDSNGFDFGKGGWLSLAHEMSHAFDVAEGKVSNVTWQTPDNTFTFTEVIKNPDGTFAYGEKVTQNVQPILVDEVRAVDRENKIRAQSGMPLRTHYNNVYIKSATVPEGESTIIKIPTQLLIQNGIGTHPEYNTNYNQLKQK